MERTVPSFYVSKPGDTLWAIARRFYHNALRAEELRRKNGLPDELVLPEGKALIL